ncbi:hypothetical protein RJ639_039278 [Escallonia herrerae]|uniref:Reverse transcriptase Ty1/copia-type domain-containing protein n=1 Tax=Escallonia herrerae TaxID=1293975 RepID=A0AA88WQH2_9ASTE|nr:hypothetical protein RJ639_039278 [Escallonia herrerae]
MFLLNELGIAYLLSGHLPNILEPSDEEPEAVTASRKKHEEDEVPCRGFILNLLSDRLYDLFRPMKSPQEIWKALENKYTSEKQGTDIFFKNSKAYRLLDLDSNVIVESRDGEFLETSFLGDSNVNPQSNNEPLNPTLVHDTNMNFSSSSSKKQKEGIDLPIETRKSQRVRKEKNLGSDFISSQAIVFLVEGSRDEVVNKIPIVLHLEEDPRTYSEAMASRYSAFWKEAINDEMDSLLSNDTWDYGVVICLYVDDMLIIGTNMNGVNDTKKYLASQFKMKTWEK